jgi:hypothetical protein
MAYSNGWRIGPKKEKEEPQQRQAELEERRE